MDGTPCECGWKIGQAACRARFDELIARDFSDPAFFRTHRLFVDTYALQHPREFCVSAKSLAAHLCDLCAILERDASPATGYEPLQRWLNGSVDLERPHQSWNSCSRTLEYLADLNDPEAWSNALRDWAQEVWHLYHPKLQIWTRRHLDKVG